MKKQCSLNKKYKSKNNSKKVEDFNKSIEGFFALSENKKNDSAHKEVKKDNLKLHINDEKVRK